MLSLSDKVRIIIKLKGIKAENAKRYSLARSYYFQSMIAEISNKNEKLVLLLF